MMEFLSSLQSALGTISLLQKRVTALESARESDIQQSKAMLGSKMLEQDSQYVLTFDIEEYKKKRSANFNFTYS